MKASRTRTDASGGRTDRISTLRAGRPSRISAADTYRARTRRSDGCAVFGGDAPTVWLPLCCRTRLPHHVFNRRFLGKSSAAGTLDELTFALTFQVYSEQVLSGHAFALLSGQTTRPLSTYLIELTGILTGVLVWAVLRCKAAPDER